MKLAAGVGCIATSGGGFYHPRAEYNSAQCQLLPGKYFSEFKA
jgi:hypothetical protein